MQTPIGTCRRRFGSSQASLHDGDVEPAVELAADLALDAHQLEAAARVQRPRGVAAGLDAGDHRVEPATRWRPRPAGRAGPCRSLDPCGRGARRPSPRPSCGRRRAPCRATARRSPPPGAPRRRRRSPRTRRCAPPAILLLLDRPRDDVERRRRRRHLAVVDLGDRRGVGGGGEPDGDRRPAGDAALSVGHGPSVPTQAPRCR